MKTELKVGDRLKRNKHRYGVEKIDGLFPRDILHYKRSW